MAENRNRPRIVNTPDDPRHGTQNGYANCACRCDRCREAHTLWTREERAANQKTRQARRRQPATTVRPDPLARAAALAVVERARDADDARLILDALGLLAHIAERAA